MNKFVSQILSLLIKLCLFLRTFKCNETHNKSFGPALTAANEIIKCVVLILDDLIVSYTNG